MTTLLTAREIANVLRVSPATVYAKAKAAQIPCFHVGDRVLFDRDEVLAAIRQPTESGEVGNLKIDTFAPARARQK